MRRPRPTQSRAKGHGVRPLIVREIDPVDEHPSLGPLRQAKLNKLLGKRGRGKTKIVVKVETDG